MNRFVIASFLAVSSVYLFSGAATADTMTRSASSRQHVPARDELITSFTAFAGSGGNAASLVDGLRSGSLVTLATTASGGGAGITGTNGTNGTNGLSFMPPTRAMGWGNVRHALTLAQRELAVHGITNPTPAELQAALTGGSITTATGGTATLAGNLTLRSEGMGWGKIAHTLGVPLGNKGSSHEASHTSSHGGNGLVAVVAREHRVGAVTTAGGQVLRPAQWSGGGRSHAHFDAVEAQSTRSGSSGHVMPSAGSVASTVSSASGPGLRIAANHGRLSNSGSGRAP